MQFTGFIERIDSTVWAYIVRVPQDIVDEVLLHNTKRVVCSIGDVIEFQCALMPAGNGSYFINLNQEIRTQLTKHGLVELPISLRIDESEYGLPFPEELQALLELDEEGNTYFHALTKGKQRNILHLVGKPKNSDIRIRKAITVVDHLKMNRGKLDFKQLYEQLKLKNNP